MACPDVPEDIVERVVAFDRWCMEQPRGSSAGDDTMTIDVVALRERLFEHDTLLPIIPRLMSREESLQNTDYFDAWVGANRVEAALRLYGEESSSHSWRDARHTLGQDSEASGEREHD